MAKDNKTIFFFAIGVIAVVLFANSDLGLQSVVVGETGKVQLVTSNEPFKINQFEAKKFVYDCPIFDGYKFPDSSDCWNSPAVYDGNEYNLGNGDIVQLNPYLTVVYSASGSLQYYEDTKEFNYRSFQRKFVFDVKDEAIDIKSASVKNGELIMVIENNLANDLQFATDITLTSKLFQHTQKIISTKNILQLGDNEVKATLPSGLFSTIEEAEVSPYILFLNQRVYFDTVEIGASEEDVKIIEKKDTADIWKAMTFLLIAGMVIWIFAGMLRKR